ncbi:hypothetical protein JOB18_014212 [Solea senegalensis]|uniref:Uncharacterized protein n=1 Tax=Solea senegalensis TaxID=28829 RepID=A0AAV6PVJ6_SOLSE|nr:hypothetical protein JOB18_014212 [Solea senegalensis]
MVGVFPPSDHQQVVHGSKNLCVSVKLKRWGGAREFKLNHHISPHPLTTAHPCPEQSQAERVKTFARSGAHLKYIKTPGEEGSSVKLCCVGHSTESKYFPHSWEQERGLQCLKKSVRHSNEGIKVVFKKGRPRLQKRHHPCGSLRRVQSRFQGQESSGHIYTGNT